MTEDGDEKKGPYQLPAGVSSKVIQERIAKRKPNPAWSLTQKEKAAFRFRPPKAKTTKTSLAKPTPLWQDHDFHANKHGPRQLIVLDDGTEYVGDWRLNLRHGYGKHFTSKGMYEGEFCDDEYSGTGTYFIWSDKNNFEGVPGRFGVYDGEWLQGKKSGSGKEWTLEGDFYEGSFLNGYKHGYGKMVYSNGDVYEEENRGLRDGNGKLVKENGDWFQGIYQEGLRNGAGELHIIKTERRLEGYWKQDNFIGGSYYDEPSDPKYKKDDDISGTVDGMIPVLELVDADAVLAENAIRNGMKEEPVKVEVVKEEEDDEEEQFFDN